MSAASALATKKGAIGSMDTERVGVVSSRGDMRYRSSRLKNI